MKKIAMSIAMMILGRGGERAGCRAPDRRESV